MIDTNGLSLDQERELAARVQAFRHHNRFGSGESEKSAVRADRSADCQTEAAGPATGANQRIGLTEEVSLDNVDDVMRYQPWMPDQVAAGDIVRETLVAAVKAILRVVPRCPNRTKAINHLIDARMDANAAISFRGRF